MLVKNYFAFSLELVFPELKIKLDVTFSTVDFTLLICKTIQYNVIRYSMMREIIHNVWCCYICTDDHKV